MVIQSLAEFQQTFQPKPVEIEVTVAKEGVYKVYLKPLTSAQRDAFEASVVGQDGKRDLSNLRARLVADCLVTAEGKPIGSAKELGGLDARLVGALFDEVRKLNGMDSDAVEEAGKG